MFVERAVLHRSRRARRLRLEEGQQRLAAAERPAAVQRLQRAGDALPIRAPTASSATATMARRSRRSTSTTRPAAAASWRRTSRLRGHLQDVRVLGEQALQQPLVAERVVLVHLDGRVRQQLLQQPLRHGGQQLRVLRQLPDEPERAHRERVHQLEREVQRHGRRRLGPPRDAGR